MRRVSGGPVVVDIRAAWQANTGYSPGDVYTYLGGAYEVTSPYTSGGSFGASDLANTTVWEAQSGTYALSSGGVVIDPITSYGAVGDGIADDTAAINAAFAALGGLPGTVVLRSAKGYGISAPIIIRSGQKLIGTAFADKTAASGSSLIALAGFSGEAMVKSYSWDNGDTWAAGAIEWIYFWGNNNAAAGIAIYQMGEEAVIRNVRVNKFTGAAILLTGVHAPATIEMSSVDASPYGVKLTTHPTLPGNSGVVRLNGLSGDLNTSAHVYSNGSHAISCPGLKSEQNNPVFLFAGSGSPHITASGYANNGILGGDVFKITDTSTPRISAPGLRASGYTNYINDTTETPARVWAQTDVGLAALVTGWYGPTAIGGRTVKNHYGITRTGNGSVAIDASKSDFFDITLAGNATSCTIINAVTGQEIVVTFIQDGTGSRTYVWPTATYVGGAAPTNQTAANARDSVRLTYDGTAWYELSRSRTATISSAIPKALGTAAAGSGATGAAAAEHVHPKTAQSPAARNNQYLYAPASGQFLTGAVSNGSLRYSKLVVDRACTAVEIQFEIVNGASAGGTFRVGIYADDGSGFPTGSPLVDVGSIDVTSSGTKTSGVISVSLSPGVYWVSGVGQGAPGTPANVRYISGTQPIVQLSGANGGSNSSGLVDSASTTGALPSANPNSNTTAFLLSVKVTVP